MHAFLAYLMNRLDETSTWRGIIALMTACGIAIRPELGEAIVAAGLAGIGVVGALFPDLKPVEPEDEPDT